MSLDNARNTVLGHIQIDYRIAAAMSNFNHMPYETDGLDSEKIATRMIKRSKLSENPLIYFISKQLRTSMFKEILLNDITDFPKLTLKKIVNRITLGSFHAKISLSYIGDLIEEGIGYLYLKHLDKSKIIATEIISRHRRSKKKENINKTISHTKSGEYKNKYKVFIKYVPSKNSTKAIKGIKKFFNISFRLI